MDKPRVLHTLAVIAAVLSAVGVLLGIALVLNPHIAAVLIGYGSVNEIMDAKFSEQATVLMLVQAALPAVITVICIINVTGKKVSGNRSLLTLIAVPAAYITVTAASFIVYTIALKISVSDGVNSISLISSVTSVKNVLSYLQLSALVMIMCAASVERYIAVKEDN